MFVEIARLFVVFLATVAGHTVGRAWVAGGDTGPLVGAVVGAGVGYVAGGILGRLIGRVMGHVESRVHDVQAGRLLVGGVGAAFVGGLCAIVSVPVVLLLPPLYGWAVAGLVLWCGLVLGYRVTSSKFEQLLALAGLSTRPLVRATPFGAVEPDALLVDTSAVLDGRLLAVARAGFLEGTLLVPQFVLDEVQAVADSPDEVRRRKGRRGLDLLETLQRLPGIDISVLDDPVTSHDEVDAKLVELAHRLRVRLLTVDVPLQRVAELRGVRCLNLHRLSEGLRPALVPGELVRLPITREGREEGQGVGFLDDGTMVVVNGAAGLVGAEVDVRVTGNAKTAVGTMLFGSLAGVPHDADLPTAPGAPAPSA